MRAQNLARSLQMTEPALDLVIAALERIRESTDRAPRASRTVLAQLRTVSVAISLPATPKSNEGARETSASPTGRRLQALPSKAALLDPIRERVCICTKCPHLACSPTQTDLGVGDADADVTFIREAPRVPTAHSCVLRID